MHHRNYRATALEARWCIPLRRNRVVYTACVQKTLHFCNISPVWCRERATAALVEIPFEVITCSLHVRPNDLFICKLLQ